MLCMEVKVVTLFQRKLLCPKKSLYKHEQCHARLVRLPTSTANSVSTFKEMSSAFTECVNAPLFTFQQQSFNL